MPSGRPSDPRTRASGSGPRGGVRRTSTQRPGSRPGAGPGPRRAPTRARSAPAPATAHRPRVTGRAAILVLVLAMLMVSYASSMRAYLEQRQHLANLRAEIASSQADINRLEREKKRWSDPAYVRTVAHERFGWVLPGEIGYQVIDKNGKPLGHTDTLTDPSTVVEANRPLWWQAAWGSVVAAGEKPADQSDVPPPATKIRPPQQPKESRR